MSVIKTENLDLLHVEDTLWVLSKRIQPSYDFDFQNYFHCQHPTELPFSCVAVSRAGPRVFYDVFYRDLMTDGVRLIHDPKTHLLCSDVPLWYDYIKDLTPRSMWFDDIPDFDNLMENFELPIFVRGARKTKRHSKTLSIIEDVNDYARIHHVYTQDSILSHQQVVFREFASLRKVADVAGDFIPASFEFRTFWWRGQFVGGGRYWVNVPEYTWTESEKSDALDVAEQAASALPVQFLVVDVGQLTNGKWIVIEVNDAQDCGYADIPPEHLWQNILAVERAYHDGTK